MLFLLLSCFLVYMINCIIIHSNLYVLSRESKLKIQQFLLYFNVIYRVISLNFEFNTFYIMFKSTGYMKSHMFISVYRNILYKISKNRKYVGFLTMYRILHDSLVECYLYFQHPVTYLPYFIVITLLCFFLS